MNIDSRLSVKLTNMGFLCSMLVILIHTGVLADRGSCLWWVSSLTGKGIATVAVPYFFLVSGFMLGKHCWGGGGGKWYLQEISKRISSIWLPFVIWNLLYVLWIYGLLYGSRFIGYSTNVAIPPLLNLGDWVAALGLNPAMPSAHEHLWYLRSLFLFVLLSPLLLSVIRGTRTPIVVIALYAGFGVVRILLEDYGFWAWFFDRTLPLQGLGFFAFGVHFGRMPIKIERPIRLGGIALILGMLCFIVKAIFLFVYDGQFSAIGILLRWCAIPLTLYGLWVFCPEGTVFGGLAKYSFPIYIVHAFVGLAMAGFLGVMGLRDAALHVSVSLYFARWVVCACLAIAFVRILKFFPRFYAVAFGRRG